jgi:hypothetical protein
MGDGSNTLCCNPFQSCFSPKVSKENATFFANIVQVLQEFIAVAFHLVCLSRLETTADIKSNLVLFLTLVVFTGPYLNAWLVFAEYIIFKKWKGNMIWENILVGVGITAAHVVGSLLAWGCVLGMEPASVNTIKWNKENAITWNITDPTKQKEALNVSTNWHVHFFEEIFAVASLLIGFIYLLWLAKLRKAKSIVNYESIIKIDIKFYFQLTLLVAAVAQAFPSARLSPHVLSYKLLMQTITIPEFFSRLAGGAIGLMIACVWCLFRVSYRKSVQTKVDDEHDHNAHVYEQVGDDTSLPMQNVNAVAGTSRQMPGIRLSMHGSSYF